MIIAIIAIYTLELTVIYYRYQYIPAAPLQGVLVARGLCLGTGVPESSMGDVEDDNLSASSEFSTLATSDRTAMAASIRLRPPVETTADRIPCEASPAPVFFDWQHAWSRVRPLLNRRDVRLASLQSVKYLDFDCQFCDHTRSEVCSHGLTMFPLMLGHDRVWVGGDGHLKADFAFGVMPNADADALIIEEERALAHLGEEEDEFDTRAYDVVGDLRSRCVEWLENNFDDARVLCDAIDSGVHLGNLPLLFKLAQHLAPAGAQLELRFSQALVEDIWKLNLPDRMHCGVRRVWGDGLCYDRTNGIVYTLCEDYFVDLSDYSSALPEASVFLEEHPIVGRRWNKDGGIPRLMFAWMRFRKGVPVDVVRVMQKFLGLGTDEIDVPDFLERASAVFWVQDLNNAS